MPKDDYEPQVLALLERCAAALERIAQNTEPVEKFPPVSLTQ